MKTICYILMPLLVLAFAGCKKDPKPDPVPDPQPLSSVTIGAKTYPTVKIGDKYWLAVNFDAQGGVQYSGTIARPEYGNYYSVADIKAFTLPAGWRIPTEADYRNMMTVNGIDPMAQVTALTKKLTSATHWLNVNGTNASGFNALPAGYVFNNGKAIDGDIAEFWVADGKTFSIMEAGNKDALRITFFSGSDDPTAGYRFNVRLVRDL